MNSLLMAGAAASAIAALFGVGLLVVKAFVKAVEAIVGPEFASLQDRHGALNESLFRSQSEQDEEWADELRRVHGCVADLAKTVGWLEQELRPNHGTSLRDAIDRIEKHLHREGQ